MFPKPTIDLFDIQCGYEIYRTEFHSMFSIIFNFKSQFTLTELTVIQFFFDNSMDQLSIFSILGFCMDRTAASTLSAMLITAISFVCGFGPG